MASLSELPVIQKVYAYILCEKPLDHELLVFIHEDNPEAGVQVPGGAVEPKEDIRLAVQRESAEETGLKELELVQKLGEVRRDMRGFGLAEVHYRHYFKFSCSGRDKEEWIACETTPSDGSQGPIAFRFFWVDLDGVPVLHGGLGEMLSSLR